MGSAGAPGRGCSPPRRLTAPRVRRSPGSPRGACGRQSSIPRSHLLELVRAVPLEAVLAGDLVLVGERDGDRIGSGCARLLLVRGGAREALQRVEALLADLLQVDRELARGDLRR